MKLKINNIITIMLTYSIAIIMILNCNSIFVAGLNSNSINKIELEILIVAVILLIIIKSNDVNWYSYIICITGLIVYLVIYLLVQPNKEAISSGFIYIIRFLLMFSLAYTMYKFKKIPNIFYSYCNVMVVIACVSLFFWIFGTNLHIIQPTGVYYSNWNQFGIYQAYPKYYNLYFETQVLNQITRNSSIFAEAPMASLTFSIALCIETIYLKKSRLHILKIIILSLAIVSTISSTGYIFLILIFGYKLLTITNFNYYSNIIKLLVIPVMLIIGMLLIHYFLDQKLSTNSGLSRSKDYINSIKAWVNYPILGTGIDTLGSNLTSALHLGIGNFGYSNSLGAILGSTGLYIFILYFISIVKSFYFGIREKDTNRIFITFIFIYFIVTTNFLNTYILFFFFSLLAIWEPNIKIIKEKIS